MQGAPQPPQVVGDAMVPKPEGVLAGSAEVLCVLVWQDLLGADQLGRTYQRDGLGDVVEGDAEDEK